MYIIKQPSKIIFGKYSARDYKIPQDSLVITSKGAKPRGWLDYIGLDKSFLFDNVEPNPSMEVVTKIVSGFKSTEFSYVIGIGGGSSLDVAKYVAFKLKKKKIMIPTTFGSGSEVTRISVLKIDGKKKSFHDDQLISDIAIVDPYFIETAPTKIIKNSAIDACAQCSEGFDSKSGNEYTRFLCEKAFNLLEDGLLNKNNENLSLGSLIAGLGFGNCSTTLGHALSYVYSNEGISHGHALAFTTTVAHKFNNSKFYKRFLKLVRMLNFSNITLKGNLEEASELILQDKKHLDNNPRKVTKIDIINLLEIINTNRALDD